MILPFSQKFPDGTPTYFVEKIINSVKSKNLAHIDVMTIDSKMNHSLLDKFGKLPPKIHTIRRDSKDRWRIGNKIHFVINNRTKDRIQFAPVLIAKGIQSIEITNGICKSHRQVVVDGKAPLTDDEIHDLAMNDGFPDVEKFWEWFNEDFTGKIIHWTDWKY